jgi:hypothetical protein
MTYRNEEHKGSPTYSEIANDYRLWMEYADTLGLDSEEAFNSMTEGDKIKTLIKCFGPEERPAQ